MAAHIPKSILEKNPPLAGLILRNRGKVRDSYDLPGHPDKMLVVASDRLSIFDFVMPGEIPEKGPILTALNHYWRVNVLNAICTTDFVACGAEIDAYLPESLRNNSELQKRATVVNIVSEPQIEGIVRFFLTGSGLEIYRETGGEVCGNRLPPGLVNGSQLAYPIYTPTTKAKTGHDKPLHVDEVAKAHGADHERLALQVAQSGFSFLNKRGILLPDTKLEFGRDSEGRLILCDEALTPDSSRFWEIIAWAIAHKKGALPPSLDKQFVRNWGKTAFVECDEAGRKRDPENEADLAFVDSLEVPADIIEMTRRLYRYIFWRITGMKLEIYQDLHMGISLAETPKLKIHVLVGSESDLPQTKMGFASLLGTADVSRSVASCHRNIMELITFIENDLSNTADIIIAGAGMAAALPGMVKSILCAKGASKIPVIGVAFESEEHADNYAAILSIERLPGQPVELDPNGKAYFGAEGFLAACQSAVSDEFLPKAVAKKPAKFNMTVST
jgi:phosphoribosylaminoimidazole-succinocarboxamide synthase